MREKYCVNSKDNIQYPIMGSVLLTANFADTLDTYCIINITTFYTMSLTISVFIRVVTVGSNVFTISSVILTTRCT